MYKILDAKPQGKRLLGRPKLRWEDNIRMDVRELGFEGVDQIHMTQNRDRWQALMNTVLNVFHEWRGIC
jgi:hypothetical protein